MDASDAPCSAVILPAKWKSTAGKETRLCKPLLLVLFVAEQTLQFCACIVILGGWQRGWLVIVQGLVLCFVVHFSVIHPAINQGLFLGFDSIADVNETTSFSPL
jgi:hypothetical protein